jgi:hypothetical protein
MLTSCSLLSLSTNLISMLVLALNDNRDRVHRYEQAACVMESARAL